MKLSTVLTHTPGLRPKFAVVDTSHYQGFVKEAAQTLQVWGLIGAGGWISLPLEDGQACLPVWSRPHGAQVFARGPWVDCTVGAIGIPDFLDHWLPAMDSLGVQVAVQPDDTQTLALVPARVLAWHLQVRCVNFPVHWTLGRPGPGSES